MRTWLWPLALAIGLPYKLEVGALAQEGGCRCWVAVHHGCNQEQVRDNDAQIGALVRRCQGRRCEQREECRRRLARYPASPPRPPPPPLTYCVSPPVCAHGATNGALIADPDRRLRPPTPTFNPDRRRPSMGTLSSRRRSLALPFP